MSERESHGTSATQKRKPTSQRESKSASASASKSTGTGARNDTSSGSGTRTGDGTGTSTGSGAKSRQQPAEKPAERSAGKPAEQSADQSAEQPAEQPAERPAPKKPGAAQVLRSAQDTLEALTGLESESVSSVIRGDDGGWTLHVEVVELRRLPDSTSMLGSYEVTLDEDGELTGYRRLRRYERGKADPK
ncbi:gas vesicle protein [Streptomyces axinellae]|uniref:Gas vesicle protein n=1 Tax=Streptomyces axinellae TaxID=552788 RepID=A0ABP6D004_9ACTN